MSVDRPVDYGRLVRARVGATRGFILATAQPCLSIRSLEFVAIQRDLQPAVATRLSGLNLPGSWLLAVLLCPGDTTDDVAGWAARLPVGAVDRIRFYVHPKADVMQALSGWVGAGLPPPRVHEIPDWKAFHRQFGLHLTDMTYRDARAALVP